MILAKKLMALQTAAAPAGGIEYIGSVTGAAEGGVLLSMDLTSLSLQEDDILILGVNVADAFGLARPTSIATAGYTEIESLFYFGNSRSINLLVASKVMGATPDTTADVTASSSSIRAQAAVVRAYRGASGVAASPPTATGNTELANPPSISPTTVGSTIIGMGCVTASGGGDGTFTSSDLNDFATIGQDDSYSSTIGAGHQMDWQSGAVDPAQFGFVGSPGPFRSFGSITLELLPT